MTEIIKDDIAPGPRNRKTERPVMNNGVPVLLLYDEENDRTVMARGDISGGLRVIGMMYEDSSDSYIPSEGAAQGGINKAFVNTDSLEDKMENVIEQLRIMNLHLSMMTEVELDREDVDKE